MLIIESMTIIVDGNKRSLEIKNELGNLISKYNLKPVLNIIYVGSDPIIDNFIQHKEKFAHSIGVKFVVHKFKDNIKSEDLVREVTKVVALQEPTIVQLPLPNHIDSDEVINLLNTEIDVDALRTVSSENIYNDTKMFLCPVVMAIIDIFDSNNILLDQKKIVLVGNGKIVGRHTSLWLESKSYDYRIITKESSEKERKDALIEADIIISGVGIPSLISKDDIKENVVIIDAGTSGTSKQIEGDVDSSVIGTCSLLSPVPGGVGPITIAMLYRNVISTYNYE